MTAFAYPPYIPFRKSVIAAFATSGIRPLVFASAAGEDLSFSGLASDLSSRRLCGKPYANHFGAGLRLGYCRVWARTNTEYAHI